MKSTSRSICLLIVLLFTCDSATNHRTWIQSSESSLKKDDIVLLAGVNVGRVAQVRVGEYRKLRVEIAWKNNYDVSLPMCFQVVRTGVHDLPSFIILFPIRLRAGEFLEVFPPANISPELIDGRFYYRHFSPGIIGYDVLNTSESFFVLQSEFPDLSENSLLPLKNSFEEHELMTRDSARAFFDEILNSGRNRRIKSTPGL